MIIQQQKKRPPGSGSTGPAAGPRWWGLPRCGRERYGWGTCPWWDCVEPATAPRGGKPYAQSGNSGFILTSRQVARLDWFQQALFVRLILGCDDTGGDYGPQTSSAAKKKKQ